MFEKLKNIGPGAMIAAAFIGPGTVTTATISGANYGYTLLWAILFSIFATIILQEMSARLGVVGRLGLGDAIRKKITQPVLKTLAAFLVIGAILIGNAAYEAGNITGAVLGFNDKISNFGLPFNPLIFLIGGIAFLLLYFGKYKTIERFLVGMVTIMGIVFFVSAILLKPDLGNMFKGIFTPSLPDGSILMIVGLIGTTVVPYNLFLHASSVKERWSGSDGLSSARWDTFLSVILGGLITMSIVTTSAIAFGGTEKTVKSAADLAVQLEPILGNWSGWFVALGFLAAGLSSSVTAPLAAAYATSGILGWSNKDKDILNWGIINSKEVLDSEEVLKGDSIQNLSMTDQRFRMVWIFVLLAGVLFSTLGFKPLMVILFAQVANGLLLPIIAIFLLMIMNDKSILKEHTNSLTGNILGGIVILITLGLGMKGLLSAGNWI